MGEKYSRSLVKTVSWRVIATLTTAVLVYVFTGSFFIAFGVGALEIVSKLFFYFLHERAWDHITWGRSS